MPIWENDPIIGENEFIQPANPDLKGWQGDPIIEMASPGDELPRQDYAQLFESKKYSELAGMMADPNTPGIASIFGEDVRDVANNLPESERPLFLNQLNRAVEDRRIQNQGRGYLQGIKDNLSYGYEGALSSLNQFVKDSSAPEYDVVGTDGTEVTLRLKPEETSAQDFAYQSNVQGLRQATAPENRSLTQRGVEGAARMVPDLMASIGATMSGGPAAGFSYWYGRTQPEIKNAMINEGVDEDIADVTSNLGTVPIAAIEFIRIGDFAPSLKTKVQAAIQKTVADQAKRFAPEVIKRVAQTAAGRATGQFANEYVVQVAQEGAQSLLEASTVTVGKVLQEEGFTPDAIATAQGQFYEAGMEFVEAGITMPFLLGGSRAAQRIPKLPSDMRYLANLGQDRVEKMFATKQEKIREIAESDTPPSRKDMQELGITEKTSRKDRVDLQEDLRDVVSTEEAALEPYGPFPQEQATVGESPQQDAEVIDVPDFNPSEFGEIHKNRVEQFKAERKEALSETPESDVNNLVREYGIDLPKGEKTLANKREAVANIEAHLFDAATQVDLDVDTLKTLVNEHWNAEVKNVKEETPRLGSIEGFIQPDPIMDPNTGKVVIDEKTGKPKKRTSGLFRHGMALHEMEYNDLRSLLTRLQKRIGQETKQDARPDKREVQESIFSILESRTDWPFLDELGDNFERNDLGGAVSNEHISASAWRETLDYIRRMLDIPEKYSEGYIDNIAAIYESTAGESAYDESQEPEDTFEPWADENQEPVYRGFIGSFGKMIGFEPKRKEMSKARRLHTKALSAESRMRRDINRGVVKESFWSKKKRQAVDKWYELIRRQRYLDMGREKDRIMRQLLRMTQGRMGEETERTIAEIIAIVKDMTNDEKVIYEDLLDYEDMNAEWEAFGLESAFRNGVRSEKQLKTELNNLRQAAEELPAVKEAMNRRLNIIKPLVEQLVERKLISEEALENPNAYVHRMVMIHQKGSQALVKHLQEMGKISIEKKVASTTQELIEKTFGYQISRIRDQDMSDQRYDYNTNIIESDFDWIVNARHQMVILDFLQEVDEKLNEMPKLEAQAKKENEIKWMGGIKKYNEIMRKREQAAELDAMKALGEIDPVDYREARAPLTKWIGENDPTVSFRRKMATAISKAKDILGIEDDADVNWNDIFQDIMDNNPDSEAAVYAKMYFKAMGEQKAEMKKAIGPVGFVTVKKIVDRDPKYDFYQPHPGNRFYTVLTISEAAAAEMQAAILKGVQIDPSDIEIAPQFAVANNKPMVLETNLANQLNSMEVEEDYTWATTREWKKAVLLAPFRLPGYVLRNKLGDLEEFVFGLIGHTGRGTFSDGIHIAWNWDKWRRDLAQAEASGKALTSVQKRRKALMDELLPTDVVGASFTATDLGLDPELRRYARMKDVGAWQKLTDSYNTYMRWASKWAQFSENSTRIQAYLDYKNMLEKNRETGAPINYGASDAKYIDSIRGEFGDKQAAAQMARDLIGDYGETTVLVDKLSKNLMGFLKFQGVNFERQIRSMINMTNAIKNAKTKKEKTQKAAIMFAKIMLRPAMGVALWNFWNYDDEDDNRSHYDRANPTIKLWTRADGSVVVFRNFSTSGDFFEWFGLNSLPILLRQYYDGQIDAGTVISEMALDPANKVVGSVTPNVKMPVEFMIGETFFPNAFDPQDAERDQILASPVMTRDTYRGLKGYLTQSGERGKYNWDDFLLTSVTGTSISDQMNNVLNETYSYIDRYKKSKGIPTADYPASPASNMKRAVQFKDQDSFNLAKANYIENGGDTESFLKSIQNYDPVERLNEEQTKEFMTEYLNPYQAKRADAARDYVKRIQATMWTWWVEDENRKGNMSLPGDFQKKVGSQINKIATKRSSKTDTKGRSWDDAEKEIAQWLIDRDLSLNDSIDYLRNYYKQRDNVSPATRARNLRLARSRLAKQYRLLQRNEQ